MFQVLLFFALQSLVKSDQIAQLVAHKNSACKNKIEIHKDKATGVSSNRAETTKNESATDSVDSVKSLSDGNANGYFLALVKTRK